MGEYPFTEEGLRACLDRLGRRRSKVRRTLVKHGILGDPDSCNSCPLVVWIQRCLGYEDVIVDGPQATVTRDVVVDPEGYGDYYADAETIRLWLPRPVVEFVAAFDAREYPELIRIHPKEPAI